jgi:hypothetical protein
VSKAPTPARVAGGLTAVGLVPLVGLAPGVFVALVVVVLAACLLGFGAICADVVWDAWRNRTPMRRTAPADAVSIDTFAAYPCDCVNPPPHQGCPRVLAFKRAELERSRG